MYIADEVMVGFGRTGEWFGVDHARVSPDLMAFARGVNSGYVPLGGVLVGDAIYDTFVHRPYPGGLTYSGHPVACAAAVGTLRAMHDEGLVASAARLGRNVLGPGLRALAGQHPSVADVRGIGALWTLELVRDRTTREPLVPYAASGPCPSAAPMAALGPACLDRVIRRQRTAWRSWTRCFRALTARPGPRPPVVALCGGRVTIAAR